MVDFLQSCSRLQSDLTGMLDYSATSNKLTCSAQRLQECGTTCRGKSWQRWKHTTKQELTSDISSFSGAVLSKGDSSKGAKKNSQKSFLLFHLQPLHTDTRKKKKGKNGWKSKPAFQQSLITTVPQLFWQKKPPTGHKTPLLGTSQIYPGSPGRTHYQTRHHTSTKQAANHQTVHLTGKCTTEPERHVARKRWHAIHKQPALWHSGLRRHFSFSFFCCSHRMFQGLDTLFRRHNRSVITIGGWSRVNKQDPNRIQNPKGGWVLNSTAASFLTPAVQQ